MTLLGLIREHLMPRADVCCGLAKALVSEACGKVCSAEPCLRLTRNNGGCCHVMSLLAQLLEK